MLLNRERRPTAPAPESLEPAALRRAHAPAWSQHHHPTPGFLFPSCPEARGHPAPPRCHLFHFPNGSEPGWEESLEKRSALTRGRGGAESGG